MVIVAINNLALKDNIQKCRGRMDYAWLACYLCIRGVVASSEPVWICVIPGGGSAAREWKLRLR
jgi:hypothetical protein